MSERKIHFFITFGELSTEISLLEYDTIADLKRKIADIWNLPVHQQGITGWIEEPCGDNVILQACSMFGDLCCLDVSDNSLLPSFANMRVTAPKTSCQDYTVMEVEAIRSFKDKIPPNLPVKIQNLTLEDGVFHISNSSTREKVLMLYFHNSTDPFSNAFVDCLFNSDTVKIINKNFFFLPWDVETQKYHRAIKSAINQYDALSVFQFLIDEGTAAAIYVFFEDNCLKVFSCMKGNVSADQMYAQLLVIQESLCPKLSADMEIEAIHSLRSKLIYRSELLTVSKLKDVITRICTGPLNERKSLVLFLYNSNVSFGKLFSENMASGELGDLLRRSFVVLGWDVEDETYHNALVNALNEYPDLSCISDVVRRKDSVAMCIIPVAGSISLAMCCKGSISLQQLIDSLLSIETILKTELETEEELDTLNKNSRQNLDPVSMQCIFADRLGDRDYDGFEFNEHNYLKEKIGFAMYGPPTEVEGYGDKLKKHIEFIYNVIVTQSAKIAESLDVIEMSCIYNCTTLLPEDKLKMLKNNSTDAFDDLKPVPIFVLRKCRYSNNPCRLFIDDTGRVYETWQGYITKNKLPQCQMVLPLNGRYSVKDGVVELEKHLSPACQLDTKILQAGDIVGTATGLLSGGLFIAAAIPAVTIAPFVLIGAAAGGVAAGVWAIGRSIHNLVDRNKHEESISFANSEARGAYLNIVAGSLGFVGAGANVAMTQLAARGVNIGQGATYAFNTLGVMNITASGVSLVNSGYDVIDQWINEKQAPSALTIIQLSSSILFFGHAVFSFRGAQTIVEETQAKVLSDYQDSLRSNRHKKTFNKLVKETQRTHGGGTKGNAEVISAIKNFPNKDEVFAALTRNNKEMNKSGIRFSADGGNIKFNGFLIDVNEFVTMSKQDVAGFLGQVSDTNPTPLPTIIPEPNQNFSLTTSIKAMLPNIGLDASQLNIIQVITNVSTLLSKVNGNIQTKVIDAISQALFYILRESTKQFVDRFNVLCPIDRRITTFLLMGISYFAKQVDKLQTKYKEYQRTGNLEYYEPLFDYIEPSTAKRFVQLFEFAVSVSFNGRILADAALRSISNYVVTWIAKLIFEDEQNEERKNKRRIHSARYRPKRVCCKLCGGYYFSNK